MSDELDDETTPLVDEAVDPSEVAFDGEDESFDVEVVEGFEADDDDVDDGSTDASDDEPGGDVDQVETVVVDDADDDEPSVEPVVDIALLDGLVSDDDDADDEDDDDAIADGEFVCRSCHMAKRASALADPDAMFCRDCV